VDAKLDETDPYRQEPPPLDLDNQKVASATDHSHVRGRLPGGIRPLKGGYWFIRQKYLHEALEAVAKDKAKTEEMTIEEQFRQSAIQSRQLSRLPSRPPSQHPSRRPSHDVLPAHPHSELYLDPLHSQMKYDLLGEYPRIGHFDPNNPPIRGEYPR